MCCPPPMTAEVDEPRPPSCGIRLTQRISKPACGAPTASRPSRRARTTRLSSSVGTESNPLEFLGLLKAPIIICRRGFVTPLSGEHWKAWIGVAVNDRNTELEIRLSLMKDLVEELNRTVFRQQQELVLLQAQLRNSWTSTRIWGRR